MWFQLKIEHCPNCEIEQISADLEEEGALSITYTDKNDNPILEPEPGTTPLWPEVVIQALYSDAVMAQEVKERLSQSNPSLVCSLEILPDKDWERVWMDDFKAQRFGNNLWICPTWQTPPEPNAVNLMLDPGLAFGTGNHPTTALCLTWLDKADIRHKTAIDYGCGSGILSLAAIKLGMEKVYAVDIDEQALQATANNAQTNHIDLKQLLISEPDSLSQPVDLLIANILLAPLVALQQRFYALLNPDALLVVSGILEQQSATLVDAYNDSFSLVEQCNHDGWSLLVFAKK